MMARAVLEVAAEVRSARQNGVGEGLYEGGVVELGRISEALPKDDKAHYGLLLVDGKEVIEEEGDEDGEE